MLGFRNLQEKLEKYYFYYSYQILYVITQYHITKLHCSYTLLRSLINLLLRHEMFKIEMEEFETISDKKTKLQDPFAETITEVLEAIIEAAPVAVATGGTVAAAAVIANPPLPLTLASGVPPGIFFSN